MRHLFVVDSLDKHVRNEKEFILALQGSSAGVGGGVVVWWGRWAESKKNGVFACLRARMCVCVCACACVCV